MRRLTEKAVQEMRDAGFIAPTYSEWARSMFLVLKPDGTQRFFVDYRKFNLVTIQYKFLLPLEDDCLEILGYSTIFITLDLSSAYFKILIRLWDRDNTTFTT